MIEVIELINANGEIVELFATAGSEARHEIIKELSRGLDSIEDDYDMIVIDSPPHAVHLLKFQLTSAALGKWISCTEFRKKLEVAIFGEQLVYPMCDAKRHYSCVMDDGSTNPWVP